MITSVKKLLEQNQADLDKMNDQRRMWLWASSVVFWAIIGLIFFWDWLDGFNSKSLWWFIVSCMLILSINWWYWTMRIIRKLIAHQEVEYDLLKSIIKDLSKIKQHIRLIEHQDVDNSK